MNDRWITFRGQFGVPLLFGAAVLLGALAAFAFTNGGGSGSPATPTAAGPVSTQAAPPSTAAPVKPATSGKGAKKSSGPHYLCIYPGVGARHIISPLPGGVTRATWAMTCQATDGKPAVRVSAKLFEEPETHRYFRLQWKSADGFYVRQTARP